LSSVLILRRLAGAELAQVLVTARPSSWWPMSADGVGRRSHPASTRRRGSAGHDRVRASVSTYRLAISAIAIVFAAGLWLLLDRTRLRGDDPAAWTTRRCAGGRIRVSRLFTIVFCLGAWLAGFAGVTGRADLSVYPASTARAALLVVVILGGSGSLVGSLVGSFIVGFSTTSAGNVPGDRLRRAFPCRPAMIDGSSSSCGRKACSARQPA